jgi:opacity protein-like surface antigen
MRNTDRLFAALLITGGLLTLLTTTSARADGFDPYKLGPYLKADGGISFISGPELTAGPYSGDLSLKSGYRVDGVVGYAVNDWLAAEFEGGMIEHGINSLTMRGQELHPSGDSAFSMVPLLVNVVFRYENESEFVPYLGLGAGGVLSKLNFSGEKDSDTVFAIQAKVGVTYKLTETAWLDANYKFLGTAEQSYTISGMELKTDQVYSHFFGLSVIWKF